MEEAKSTTPTKETIQEEQDVIARRSESRLETSPEPPQKTHGTHLLRDISVFLTALFMCTLPIAAILLTTDKTTITGHQKNMLYISALLFTATCLFFLVDIAVKISPSLFVWMNALFYKPTTGLYRAAARAEKLALLGSLGVTAFCIAAFLLDADGLFKTALEYAKLPYRKNHFFAENGEYASKVLYELSKLFLVLTITKYLLDLFWETQSSNTYERRIANSNNAGVIIRGLLFGIENKEKTSLEFEKKRIGFEMEKDDGLNILSEKEARNVARQIFRKTAPHGHEWFIGEDIEHLFQDNSTAVVASMGGAHIARVTEKMLKKYVVSYHKERSNLGKALAANKKFYAKFEFVIFAIVSFVAAIMLGTTLGEQISALVTLAGSVSILSFVFKDILITSFRSFVFVFLEHPFDCGDYITLDGKDYVVEEVDITTIKMTETKNSVYVHKPTPSFFAMMVTNHTRSPEFLEQKTLVVAPVDAAAVEKFKESLVANIKEDIADFTGFVSIDNIEYKKDSAEITFSVEHTDNISVIDEAWERRKKLNELVKITIENTGIQLA
ncbi:MAG: small-conductance mechanosensitive ion channel family transporter [Amphiamblys sp. WSBS2006]|nr:MAG: small-conductance mechanosensitive ion channel family transporter [Amphiamblys sp. WSBS2006]